MSRGTVLMIEVGGHGGVADYTHELVSALAAHERPVALVTARDHRFPPVAGVTVHGLVPWVRDTSAVGRAVRRERL